MFTEEFEKISFQVITDAIREDGYFAFPSAVKQAYAERMLSEARPEGIHINTNEVHAVRMRHQSYVTHCLAASRAVYDLITSNTVMSLSTLFLGDQCRLHAKRVYTTFQPHHMQWHTDNKVGVNKSDFPGIIFIVYLCDVTDGEFQYIRGSHKWSAKDKSSDYTDEYIQENFADEIQSFKMPNGSIIIYDIYGIHRAKPIVTPNLARHALFFSVAGNDTGLEPILVNTAFLGGIDEKTMEYLGFGRDAIIEPWPQTGIETLTVKQLMQIFVFVSAKLLRVCCNSAISSAKLHLQRITLKTK